MGKNIGLVTKIFMGFVCILILLGGVAFMGHRGMSLMADEIESTDDLELITRLIALSRQQEKNFILRGEQHYADAVTATLLELTRQAQTIKEKFLQHHSKEQMDRVIAKTNDYATAFGSYIEAEREQKSMMDVMRSQAGETLQSIAEIRDEQAQQLAERRIVSADEEQKQQKNADDANRIINWMLKAVAEEKNFMFKEQNEESVAAAEQLFSDAIAVANMLKFRVSDKKSAAYADSIVSLANAHLLDFTRFVELDTPKKKTMTELNDTINALRVWTDVLRREHENSFLSFQEMSQGSAGSLQEHIKSFERVSKLQRWILEALAETKDYIATKDAKHREIIKNLMAQVDMTGRLVNGERANSRQKDGVAALIELSKRYLEILSRYTELQAEQDELEERLLSHAARLEHAAIEIGEYQKEELRIIQLQTSQFIDDTLLKASDSNRLIAWFLDARKNEKELIISGEEQYATAVNDDIQQILTLAENLRQRFTQERNLEQLDAAIAAIQAYHKAFTTVVELLGQQTEAEHMMLQAARDAQQTCDEIREAQRTDMFSQMSRTNAFFLSIPPVALAIGLSIAAWISFALRTSLRQAVTLVQDISEGDLSQNLTVARRDEIGHLLSAMNVMTDRLQEMLGKIKIASGSVAAGSQNVRGSAERIAEGSNEQAASVEEISSSMEEMAANIQQNTENAAQTEQIALQAAADAQASGKAVTEAVFAMQDIAQKIAKIGDIATQTRLLSLNATIEAAGAQEQGKGFAVVASEVRALAERSRIAAQDISDLTRSGVELAETAGKMLKQLVPSIGKTAELVQEISTASREQSSSIEQITRAVQQLDQVIQQNASASQGMASTSTELSSQAEMLQSSVAFFKTEEAIKDDGIVE